MAGDIAENIAEFLYPEGEVVFRAVGDTTQFGVAHHTSGTDMDLLPAAEVGEEFYVETLVTILFGCIDIVGDSTRFFAESVGEHGVYAECHVLFGDTFRGFEHNFSEVTIFEVVEVVAIFVHFAPDAVRAAIVHGNIDGKSGGGECIFDSLAKMVRRSNCASRSWLI